MLNPKVDLVRVGIDVFLNRIKHYQSGLRIPALSLSDDCKTATQSIAGMQIAGMQSASEYSNSASISYLFLWCAVVENDRSRFCADSNTYFVVQIKKALRLLHCFREELNLTEAFSSQKPPRFDGVTFEEKEADILSNDLFTWIMQCGSYGNCSFDYQLLFYEVIKKNHAEVVRLLLQHDQVDPAKDNNKAIALAVEQGYVEVVQVLLEDGRADRIEMEKYMIIHAGLSDPSSLLWGVPSELHRAIFPAQFFQPATPRSLEEAAPSSETRCSLQ